eukprot:gene4826-3465_t
MPARQRSTSAAEEKLIDTFIQSTVNFKSTLTFTDVASHPASKVSSAAVLIGSVEHLQDSSVHSLPIYTPVVAEAISRIKEDKAITVLTQLPGRQDFVTVSVVAVSTKASRNNCPFRPECYGAGVKAAVGNLSSEGEQTLDVFVRAPAGAEVPITCGIARGTPHSFSEISGAAAKSFLSQRVTFNILFSATTVPAEELQILATSVQLCQRLVDAPTDLLDTITFAEIARGYAQALGVEFHAIEGEKLREEGYGGIYGVGKAAEYPPALVTLRYRNPHAVNGKNVALVGKGLVYDCGGLALKYPATIMSNMKTDMGGAGAVFSGFVAIVRSIKAARYQGIANLSVTLCLAENAIGPRAFRNDDILRLKSGKTVEVFNTDAEGRICLGDGIFHATNEQDFTPDVVIDMATLTGAQGIATGQRHAAIYTNEEDAEKEIVDAGKKCGDTCFPVLYCPEYHKEEYKSNFADMRNIMKTSTNAGVSCAGFFVESHLSEKFKGTHIHVDLAFPSSGPDGATGYGVALVAEYLKKF